MKVLSAGGFVASRTYVGEIVPKTTVCDIGYFYEQDVGHYMAYAGEFYDRDVDMFLSRGHLCCNLDSNEEITKKIQKAATSPSKSETLGMATHEQYSFKHYFNYIPDHFERIETACRVAKESGYKPVFFADGLLGNTAWE